MDIYVLLKLCKPSSALLLATQIHWRPVGKQEQTLVKLWWTWLVNWPAQEDQRPLWPKSCTLLPSKVLNTCMFGALYLMPNSCRATGNNESCCYFQNSIISLPFISALQTMWHSWIFLLTPVANQAGETEELYQCYNLNLLSTCCWQLLFGK